MKFPQGLFVLGVTLCIFACINGHEQKSEMLNLIESIDLDSDKVISSEELSLWALVNGATYNNAPIGALFQDAEELAGFLSQPILDGTVPVEVHTSLLNNTNLAIMWVTSENTSTSTVEYSVDNTHNLTIKVHGTTHTYTAGGWKGVIHEVHMPLLPPNTNISYHVGDFDGGWSAIYVVRTPPLVGSTRDNTRPLRIATFGDMGTYIPLGYKVCELIEEEDKKKPLDLIIHQGDIAYASTAVSDSRQGMDVSNEQEFVWDMWAQQVQPLAGVGNHEKFYNFSSYLARFKNPEPWGGSPQSIENATFWFSFDFGLVHFTMMSTEHDYSPGSRQFEWLRNDLQSAAVNRSKVPWIILIGHRPMYSSDKNEYNQHSPGSFFQKTIEPLMTDAKVDLYFCGHMHIYERIHATINGTVINASSSIYENPQAPIHVVQGNAGVFEDVNFVNPVPKWSAVRKSRIGYGRFEVFNATHLSYESVELETRQPMDTFWIKKANLT